MRITFACVILTSCGTGDEVYDEPEELGEAAEAVLPAEGGGCTSGTHSYGAWLFAGQKWYSCDGRFFLAMQYDGNLVLYQNPSDSRCALRCASYNLNSDCAISCGTALWATNTFGYQAAVMQHDGNLVIYNYLGRAVWASGTYGNYGARLTVQNDGNVVIYKKNTNTAVWATNTCCH